MAASDIPQVSLPVGQLQLGTLLVQMGVLLHDYLRLEIELMLELLDFTEDLRFDFLHFVLDCVSLRRHRILTNCCHLCRWLIFLGSVHQGVEPGHDSSPSEEGVHGFLQVAKVVIEDG